MSYADVAVAAIAEVRRVRLRRVARHLTRRLDLASKDPTRGERTARTLAVAALKVLRGAQSARARIVDELTSAVENLDRRVEA